MAANWNSNDVSCKMILHISTCSSVLLSLMVLLVVCNKCSAISCPSEIDEALENASAFKGMKNGW